MLHSIAKRLEMCNDINNKISKIDHYTWIFTTRIFRIALKITFFTEQVIFPTNGLFSGGS